MFPAASPDEDSLCDWYEDWKEGQQYGCQLSVKRQQRVLQLNLSHLPCCSAANSCARCHTQSEMKELRR
jgi:hypothetical protein